MNVIRNKLRDKDGASIFMGLMYLLVALMVGAVVMAASTASAGKMAEMKQNEQDYLNVASAARLVRDRICALTYTYKTTDGTLDNPGGETLNALDGNVILDKELKELCSILAENHQKGTSPNGLTEKTFDITGSTGVDWDTVHGSLNMDSNGKIVVGLWLGEEENKRNYYMEIEFLADGPVTDRYETYEEVFVRNEIDEETNEEIPIYETITHVHKTTTCSWPEYGCTITKGTQP